MIEVIQNANGKVEVNIFSVEGGEEIFGHSVMGFGLWGLGYGVWVMGFGLWVMGYEL